MNTKSIVIGAAVIVALGALAYTQLPKGGSDRMTGMDHSTTTMATADATASTKAYEGAMADLMAGMKMPLTGKQTRSWPSGALRRTAARVKTVLQMPGNTRKMPFACPGRSANRLLSDSPDFRYHAR